MPTPQIDSTNSDVMHPLHMGLESLGLKKWLVPRAGDEHLLAERTKIIAAYQQDVITALPEAAGAVAELAGLINERGATLESGAPTRRILKSMGTSIAEDVCVLTANDGIYRLTAAVLCFPNRWRLADKIGRTVTEIHDPVPGYAVQMSDTVDRFLAKLRPMRAVVRSNWGLSASPTLYLPNLSPPVTARADSDMYLRREEQSFLKLAGTGAVVFAIRTTVTPWEQVPKSTRNAIIAAANALGPKWLAYKALDID